MLGITRTFSMAVMHDGRPYEVHRREYNGIASEVAVKLGAQYLDLESALDKAPRPWTEILLADGVHLSPAGIALQAMVLANAARDLLAPPAQ